MKFDEYEKELLSHEDDILENAKLPNQEYLLALQKAANETMAKDKRINIRISSRDLVAIKRRANRYGIPYQTLISSILHRYLNGELKEEVIEQSL